MSSLQDAVNKFQTTFNSTEQKWIADYNAAGTTKKKWIAFIGGAIAMFLATLALNHVFHIAL